MDGWNDDVEDDATRRGWVCREAMCSEVPQRKVAESRGLKSMTERLILLCRMMMDAQHDGLLCRVG